MLFLLQSGALMSSGRRMIASWGVYSMLSCFLLPQSIAGPDRNPNPRRSRGEALRLEVCDQESNHPLSNAKVTIVLWREENGLQKKKELESRTDKDGVAAFPNVQAEKIAVNVDARGYRSVLRWINPKDLGRVIRIRMEKWRRVSK